MYDVMTYLNSGIASPRLRSEMPQITATRPNTQENQLEVLKRLSSEKR